MKIGTYESIFGQVSIATQDSKLVGVVFDGPDDLTKYMRKYKNYIINIDEGPSFDIVEKVLDHIDHGTHNQLNIYLFGTPFQIEVWEVILNIPKGKTLSYAQVASILGKPKSVRAVANAVGANPIAIIVPCHRVISSNDELGGYRWGLDIKKKLLAREGIKF